MMKRFFTFFTLLLLCYSTSFAQGVDRSGGYARILSLGNNPYIVDPEGIKINPAWASDYSDFIWGDIGSNTGGAFGNSSAGQFFGGNFDVGHGLTIGGMLTRNDFNSISIGRLDPLSISGLGVVNTLNNQIPGAAAISLNNNIELLAAYKIGKMRLGFGFAFAGTSNETSPPTGNSTSSSASQIGLNPGILVEISNGFLLDVGASLIFPSAKFEPATGNTAKVSETIIGINGRAFFKFSSKVRFVPSVAFITQSGSADNGTTSVDLPSNTVLGIGVGVEYSVGDFLLVGGPGLSSISTKTSAGANGTPPELKTSYFIFPVWNVGAEWNALDWLIGRLGYTASTGSRTTQNGIASNAITEVTQTFYAPGIMTFGIGLRFGDFALDGTVNADVLRQGLNNVAGGGATFAYLSTSYAF